MKFQRPNCAKIVKNSARRPENFKMDKSCQSYVHLYMHINFKKSTKKTGTFVRFKQIIKAECSNFMTRLILKVKYS